MEKRKLKGTDLEVSRVCMGTMTFGGQADEAASLAMYDYCLEQGVNFFDTANVYTGGRSEDILGRIMKGRREEIVLASKVGMQEDGLTKAAINREIETSLQRLQTDYVDIYYMHKPDYDTPIEESLETMGELVQAGKVRYIALSNFSSWQVCRILWLAETQGYPEARITQPMYNLMARGVEPEYMPMCAELGVSTVVYNPLAGGMLTGKHKGGTPTSGTRFDLMENYQDRYWHEANFAAIQELDKIAAEAGRSLISLAFGWLFHHTGTDCAILGASRMEQLQENLKLVEDGPLTDETVEACDKVWERLRGISAQYNR